jgi:plasmid stabilization system protein ParE
MVIPYSEHRVKWTPLAKKQWKNILDFYVKRNGTLDYSLKLDIKLEKLLASFRPSVDRPGELTNRKGIRRISFEDRFAVFFRIKQDCIEVTSIVDARRNIRLN